MNKEKASVISVSKSSEHSFNKFVSDELILLQGLGVEGDAHGADRATEGDVGDAERG